MIPPDVPAYVPLLILGVIAVGFALFVLAASHILGRPRPTSEKASTYECGMPPIGTARDRFPIKFYLVCMLFILFDVEAAFLYPWALVYKDLGLFGLLEMGAFLAILTGGFIYEWKIGALDW